jgi:hypothetical protein
MSSAADIPVKIRDTVSLLSLSDGHALDDTLSKDQPVRLLSPTVRMAEDMQGTNQFVLCMRNEGRVASMSSTFEVRFRYSR